MKYRVSFSILGVLAILVLVSGLVQVAQSAASRQEPGTPVDAEVLSINENILSGELIGAFLASPSGKISNDNIKVGVKFKVDGKLFLEDLELQHAELAYYRSRKTIPLLVWVDYTRTSFMYSIDLETGRTVKEGGSFF